MSQTFFQDDYITHLPIRDSVRVALLREFYQHENNAKKWEAQGHVLDMLDVIRNEDVEDCELANDVAWQVAYIIGCEVFPRYYRQLPSTILEPHRDLNTACAINIQLLDRASPITFDNEHDVLYNCALLNVQQTHHVRNEHERVFLKLSIFDQTYHEVLECIRGNENDLFDLSNL